MAYPIGIKILCGLVVGFFGVVGAVFFIDYYLWALNTDNVFVSVTTLSQQDALAINNITITSFEYLITEEGYNLSPMLHYSFILGVAGVMKKIHHYLMLSYIYK